MEYQMFDKLDCISQGHIVDNKRLGAVLKLAQEKQDELEAQEKENAARVCPKAGRRFRHSSGQSIRFWLNHHSSNPA